MHQLISNILSDRVRLLRLTRTKFSIEMGFPEICDEPTPAAGDNYTATTQLAEGRLTERNRFYITDYHCVLYVREV